MENDSSPSRHGGTLDPRRARVSTSQSSRESRESSQEGIQALKEESNDAVEVKNFRKHHPRRFSSDSESDPSSGQPLNKRLKKDSSDDSLSVLRRKNRAKEGYKKKNKGNARARRRELTALMATPDLKQVQAALEDPARPYLRSELTHHVAQISRTTARNFFLGPRAVKAIATNMVGLEKYEQEMQTPRWTANIYSAVSGKKELSYNKKHWKPYAADDFMAKIIDTRVNPEFIQIDQVPEIPQLERSKALPQGDLLTQLHRYVSGWAHRNGPMLFDQLDESSLLALGVLVEEAIETMLGKSGELMYAEEETVENDGTAEPKEDYRGIDSEDNEEEVEEVTREDITLEDTDGSVYEE